MEASLFGAGLSIFATPAMLFLFGMASSQFLNRPYYTSCQSIGETCFYECAKTDGFNYRSKPKLFLLDLMMSLLLAAVSKEIDYKFQRQPEFLLWMFEREPEF
ncbi:uncharacterized protein [Triticum aestivum]|uniref:uncharacterized protein isoform X3 n=1 Tax=Triticum aestivum TaxID=4565 RepID=UPI00098B1D51|nr:uncharacterized protein LOC109735099 isoform X2 [Aegilops tauschii subsp. strangulata]XP_044375079.1 uncharacterized protein LOC123097427 isoform X3 [Triticum aestivum]